MAREHRRFPGGVIYHAYNRCAHGARLLNGPDDYEEIVAILAWAVREASTRLLAYCAMPTHFHLVVWPRENDELRGFMLRFQALHAREWRERRGTSGSGAVYQDRYKVSPVQDDVHLLRLIRYVERNPLRAGHVLRAEDWPWSSLGQRAGVGARIAPFLTPSPVPLPELWTEAVNRPATASEEADLRALLQRSQPVGTETWSTKMAKALGLERRPVGRPRKR